MSRSSLSEIKRLLHAGASASDAAFLPSFFKTGKGEYGEGDVFIGVRVPHVRAVVKEVWHVVADGDIDALLASPIHEERLCGLLIMVRQFEKGDERKRGQVVEKYFAAKDRVNNWDLVDLSAPRIAGAWLIDKDRRELYRLARSKIMWHRRIAVVACYTLIKRGDFTDILALASSLLEDKHDLMHKACGWMLREVGKKDEKALRVFLKDNYLRLPRTTLRYAIEKYDSVTRSQMLKGIF